MVVYCCIISIEFIDELLKIVLDWGDWYGMLLSLVEELFKVVKFKYLVKFLGFFCIKVEGK